MVGTTQIVLSRACRYSSSQSVPSFPPCVLQIMARVSGHIMDQQRFRSLLRERWHTPHISPGRPSFSHSKINPHQNGPAAMHNGPGSRPCKTEGPKVDRELPYSRSSFTSSLTIHRSRGDRSLWTVLPRCPMVVLGDGTLYHLSQIVDPGIQLECYPGATFSHAVALLLSIPAPCPQVKTVILSFGLFGVSVHERERALPIELLVRRVHHLAKSRFPNAKIKIPLLSYPHSLPVHTKLHLAQVNRCIAQLPHLPSLPHNKVHVHNHLLHWTRDTAVAAWISWRRHML